MFSLRLAISLRNWLASRKNSKIKTVYWMNFCTAGNLRIKSSPNNASWFIQTNFLEAILKIFSTKHWCNGSFQSFYPCRLSTEKKATWMPRGAYLLVWQRVWIIKLLHDSTYDPLKQAKRTFWCFARLTINSVSGCFRRFSGKFLKQTECLERHSYFPGWKIPGGNSDFMSSNLFWILFSCGHFSLKEADLGKW